MKTMGRILFAAGTVLALSACSFSEPGSAEREPAGSSDHITVLTIGTADSGGSMYPAGSVLADVIRESAPDVRVNISASTGSYQNIAQLGEGQIDIGFVSGDAAYAAYNGTYGYSDDPQEGLRAVAALYSSVSNWMVLESSPFYYVHDLLGERIAIGPETSSTDLSAEIVLERLGITRENTEILTQGGIGFGAGQVKRGETDAVHGFAGIPVSGLSELADQTPVRLLKYTDGELSGLLAANSFYHKSVIPAGTYAGQTEAVDSFGVKCLICVDESMDEEMVWRITSILYQNRQRMADEQGIVAPILENGFMYEDLPIPLHEGARRFYEEEGLLGS